MNKNRLTGAIRTAISGSGGGEKQKKAVESPDSLFSISHARVIDLVSEGDIEGFVHGADFLRDVYFDETPIQNPDNSRNFNNFQVDARTGTQDQTYIPGFAAVENELGISVELKAAVPWSRSFTNKQLSAVNIRIGVQSLMKTNSETGDVTGTSVSYAIDVATDGGAFKEVTSSAFMGKASGPYERGHRIELPKSTVSGWVVRVRRLTPDSNTQYISNKTYVISVTEVIDGKFRYPMSALVGVQIDSSQFQSIPSRAYHLKGRRIKVPTNYDPVTRTYTGIWDGTFKVAYSNNPAWVFYDMTTQKRYGLGKIVDEIRIDKWSLYSIGQYCDEMVPDGFGGTEPRMTCNLYLQQAGDAWKVIGDLASIFRGICYWAGGSVVPVADRPADPVYTYTNANVVEGHFRYESSSRRARHTAVIVSWNDMSDFGRLKSDYYDDPEGIARFGFQLTEIVALGCTSRGQAQRFAKWLLYSEKLLTNTVTFAAGPDGTFAAPGQIVRIADKHRAGRRIGGRISSGTVSGVVLDALPDPAPMVGDSLIVTLPEGVTESRSISSIVGNGINVGVPFSAAPLAQSVWAIESTDLSTQLFRILSTQEADDGSYPMVALQHNASIFDAVDLGEAISIPPTSVIPSANQARPASVTITSVERAGEVIAMPLLTASWPAAVGAVKYQIQWQKDEGEWTPIQEVTGTTADYQSPFPGKYVAKVQAINAIGAISVPQFAEPFTLVDQTREPGVIVEIRDTLADLYGGLDAEGAARTAAIAAESAARAQALVEEAQARANAIEASAEELRTEMGALGGASMHDPDAAYAPDSVVKTTDGGLYRAKIQVPGSQAIPITDSTYWQLIGQYSSIGDAVAGLAETVTYHDQRLIDTEEGLTAVTQDATSMLSRMDTVEGALINEVITSANKNAATAATLNLLTTQMSDVQTQSSASSQIAQGMDSRVTAVEGGLASHATTLTSLQAQIDDVEGGAIGEALDSLDVRVTSVEGVNSSQASSITSLNNTVSSQGGTLSSHAASISSLSNRTTAAEGTLSSHSASITSLNNSITDINGVNSTQAGAINSLTTRVSSVEGVNSAQADSINSISTTVNGHTASINTHASSINGLNARWSVLLDVNGYISGISSVNNGNSADFTIAADKFRIISPAGGARTEYSGGNWRVYDANGVLRVRMGVW